MCAGAACLRPSEGADKLLPYTACMHRRQPHHAMAQQLFDRSLVVAELAEDLGRVLAEHRRRALDTARRALEVDRHTGDAQRAEERVTNHRVHVHRAHLRIVEELEPRAYGGAGHALRDEQRLPFERRALPEQRLEERAELRPRHHSL